MPTPNFKNKQEDAKKLSKLRQGYFLIFFSLVMVILMMPIIVRMTERNIIVMQDIQRWQQFYEQRNILDNALPRIMRLAAEEHGLGYYKFQEPMPLREAFSDSTIYLQKEEYDDYKIQYDLIGASVIPVPTASYRVLGEAPAYQRNIMSNNSADCDFALSTFNHNAYPNCNFQFNEGNNKITYGESEEDPDDAINFFYTLPVLGTGNAHNQRCTPFRLRLLDTYAKNGQPKFVDPLDHPCNWNRLEVAKNEFVTVPLFYRDPDSGDITYPDRNLFTVRFRFPCGNMQRMCDPEDRHELKVANHENDEPISNHLELDNDFSPRMVDYALVIVDPDNDNQQYFRPVDNYYQGKRQWDSDTGLFSNFELSQMRFRNEISFDQGPNQISGLPFMYRSITKTSYFNLFSNNVFTSLRMQSNTEFQLFPERFIDFLNLGTAQNLNLFYLPSSSTQFRGIYNLNELQNKELYFIFRVDSTPLSSTNNIRLNYLEYQVVSDQPFGNNQMKIVGSVRHPQAGWQRSRRDYIRPTNRFQVPSDTGVVFTN
jgi:hypothetical protein